MQILRDVMTYIRAKNKENDIKRRLAAGEDVYGYRGYEIREVVEQFDHYDSNGCYTGTTKKVNVIRVPGLLDGG